METARFYLKKRGACWLGLPGVGLCLWFIVLLGAAGSFWTTGPLARAQSQDADYETEVQKGSTSCGGGVTKKR